MAHLRSDRYRPDHRPESTVLATVALCFGMAGLWALVLLAFALAPH